MSDTGAAATFAYFSPSTGGFYPVADHPTEPTDGVALTEAQYTALLAANLGGGYGVVNGVVTALARTAPTLTLAQQAAALIASGLAITSPGTPALNATYPCDPNSQAKYAFLSQAIVAAGGKFPNGATTIGIKDIAGNQYSVTPAQYQEIALAVATFVMNCDMVIDGDSGATLPPATATIS